jgi:hypothetical protein
MFCIYDDRVKTLNAGSHIGEELLVGGERRDFTIRVTSRKLLLLVLKRRYFQQLGTRDRESIGEAVAPRRSKAAIAVAKLLSNRYGITTARGGPLQPMVWAIGPHRQLNDATHFTGGAELDFDDSKKFHYLEPGHVYIKHDPNRLFVDHNNTNNNNNSNASPSSPSGSFAIPLSVNDDDDDDGSDDESRWRRRQVTPTPRSAARAERRATTATSSDFSFGLPINNNTNNNTSMNGDGSTANGSVTSPSVVQAGIRRAVVVYQARDRSPSSGTSPRRGPTSHPPQHVPHIDVNNGSNGTNSNDVTTTTASVSNGRRGSLSSVLSSPSSTDHSLFIASSPQIISSVPSAGGSGVRRIHSFLNRRPKADRMASILSAGSSASSLTPT